MTVNLARVYVFAQCRSQPWHPCPMDYCSRVLSTGPHCPKGTEVSDALTFQRQQDVKKLACNQRKGSQYTGILRTFGMA